MNSVTVAMGTLLEDLKDRHGEDHSGEYVLT